jgi:hypothetical protein
MTMGGLDPAASTADNYRKWAREAHGHSAAYESLADSVADDAAIVGFLGTLPTDKRQPNLLFAAARYSASRLASASYGTWSAADNPICRS